MKKTSRLRNAISQKTQQIINAGIKNTYLPEEQKKIRIVNITALVGGSATLLFTLLNVYLGFTELVVIDLCVAGIGFAAYYLNLRQQHRACKTLAFIVMPLAIMIYPVFIGNIGTEYYNFLFLTIGFYVFDRKKHLLALSLYIGTIFIVSKYCISHFHFPEKYVILETVHYYPCLIVSIMLSLMVIAIFKFDTLEYQKQIDQQNVQLSQKVKQLHEKNALADALLRELNHRVKNNLQLISSLFIMQSYKTSDAQTKQALDEARIRIDTVAIMHQRMYRDTTAMESNLYLYIYELARYILQASGREDCVELEIAVDELFLKIEDTLHIGLIVNELLTNALKYGVEMNRSDNIITLSIKQVEKKLHLKILDNGAGFPEGFSIEKTTSFGIELVSAIVQQHNGSIAAYNSDSGAVVAVLMEIEK